MMKKLLILMLVLGLAATANATLVLRVAPGETLGVAPSDTAYIEPIDSEITMAPSDELWIGIALVEPVAGSGQQLAYVSIDSGTEGSGSWTGAMSYYAPQMPAPTLPNTYLGNTYYGYYDNGVHAGDFYEYGLTYSIAWPVFLGLDAVLDAKEFHCDEIGDVIIRLWDVDTVTELDSFIIHQVPEPATMLLLGLGGLFLRRRK